MLPPRNQHSPDPEVDFDRDWDGLPLKELQQLDSLCFRFEQALARDPDTSIEPFVVDLAEPQQRLLVRELVRLAIDRRLACGQRPAPDEYARQFPRWADELRHLVARGLEELGPRQLVAHGETVAFVTNDSLTTPSVPGGRIPSIPGYEIEKILGRGGMGVVYKARHLQLKRTVALKMVLAGGHAGPRELARFRIEAEAVARLQHPNIVQIHEIGEADGHPYCALEFVEGGNLASKVDGQPMPACEAAKLVEVLARTMHLAHSRNVVHRDLKPANILLTADGTPKITDFGLARQLDSDSGETQAGMVMGTPSYMAPEQASGQAHEAGPAADIYALGAILYDCLTGRPPFQGTTVVETLDMVRRHEPTAPSRVQASVPLDLETICLKCLRKEPEKRYASAAELADELVRYQRGEPILARPVGRVERSVKWVKRNPLVAGAATAVLVALLAGIAVSTWFGLDARKQAGIADEKRIAADLATEAARAEKHNADTQAALANFRLGLQAAEAGSVDKGLFLMLRAWRETPEDDVAFQTIIRRNLAGWSTQLPRLRQAYRLENVTGGERIGFGDPEGRTILTWHDTDRGTKTGTIHCWDAATGKPVGEPYSTSGKKLLSFSSDGRWLAFGGTEKGDAVVDRTTGQVIPGVSSLITDLPDVFYQEKDGEAVFWELPTGKQLPGRVPVVRTEQDRRTFKLTRAADGRPMALAFNLGAGQDGRVELVDLTTGKPGEVPLVGSSSPSVSYDGRVAMLGARHMVDWWNLASGRPFGERWKPRVDTEDLGTDRFFARDSLELHALGKDGLFRFYDLATGLQRGGDQLAPVYQATPDGRLLYTLDDASTIRVWDSSLCRLQATATANPHAAPGAGVVRLNDALFAPDHSRVLLPWGAAVLLDTHTGELLGPPLRQPSIGLYAFSRDGRYLATAPRFNEATTPLVILRDGHTGKPIGKPWVSRTYLGDLAFSPDDKTLAVGAVGGTYLLDEPAHTLRKFLPEPGNCIYGSLVFDSEGRRLITLAGTGWEGGAGLRVWDLTTAQPLSPFRSHKKLAFPPQAAWDGGELLYHLGETDSELRRLSSDGKEERGGPWPTGRSDWRDATVIGHAFSPDGRRLAVNGGGVRVRQFDTRTGQPVGATVSLHFAKDIQYSSNNKLLAINSGEDILTEVDHWGGRARAANSVTLWDADTGWPLGPPLQHASALLGSTFADQDRTVVTVSGNGIVHRWPVPQPVIDDPDRFETWMHARGGRKFVGEEAVQLTVEEWQKARRKLDERWPQADPALAELSDDLAVWHRQRANDAAEVTNDRGELYHLTRLAELSPKELAIHARIAAIHARVAGRLPEGPARDQEWKLADAAAKLTQGWPGKDDWNELRSVDASNRESWNEALWYLDQPRRNP